jgi:hypothetical protein
VAKKFHEFRLLAQKIVPAMLSGGQRFNEPDGVHGFEITTAAWKSEKF